ncbi:hypothetical protein [Leptospira santarosai]
MNFAENRSVYMRADRINLLKPFSNDFERNAFETLFGNTLV